MYFSDTLTANPNSIILHVSKTCAIEKEIISEPEAEVESIENEISLPTMTKSPPFSPGKVEMKPVLPIAASSATSPELLPVQTDVKLEFTQTKKVAAIKEIEFVDVNVTNNITTIQVQPTTKREYLQTNNNESVKKYPKPPFSFTCLVTLALKNSTSGIFSASEIYSFICDHFPYFRTAPSGWKNCIRHSLSQKDCFKKIEKPQAPRIYGVKRKVCFWAMNPEKLAKNGHKVAKYSIKYTSAIKKAMVYPDNLELLLRGEIKSRSFYTNSDEEYDDGEVELNVQPTKRQATSKQQYLQRNNNKYVNEYPKPPYSYSCLITIALKNSICGKLLASEMFRFICDHFPYFKTAPNGWKYSVGDQLSRNKHFVKLTQPQAQRWSAQRNECLWAMNPAKKAKMDEKVARYSRKYLSKIKKAMMYPDKLELLIRGRLKIGRLFTNSGGYDDGEVTLNVQSTKGQATRKQQHLHMNNKQSVKKYSRPGYFCLAALALKNSTSGLLSVSEIYRFICDHFPYFKTAPRAWKNCIRHNLSLNKWFKKIEKPQAPGTSGAQKKGYLWTMNPANKAKIDDKVAKWSRMDQSAIKKTMLYPDNLELLVRGEMKSGSSFTNPDEEYNDGEIELNTKESHDELEEEVDEEEEDEEEEDDVILITDDDIEDETSIVPPSLQPFDSRIAQVNQTEQLHSLARSNSLDNFSVHDLDLEMNLEEGNIYEELDVADAKTLLGLNNGAPSFDSESEDDQEVVVPVQKQPRIQGNYVYQPVKHINKHNLSGFRFITVENP